MARYDALESLLGADAVAKVRKSKVLLVGAGGIGCEVIKELVVAGFGEIHVVDLDTIDLSNLNRQFLFGQQHIKQPKAKVAAEVASEFNPDVHIVPYVSNIVSDPRFTPKFFSTFQLVFNALDNAEARQHVNHMCVAMNVPLIDCGSAGFAGQAQVVLPGKSECYDCATHPPNKGFAVCTIRSTPSQPIHCVVWSKSFLFALLFGSEEQPAGDDQENDEPDDAEAEQMKNERNELGDLKRCMGDADFVDKMVRKVFVTDIERLRGMRAETSTGGGPTPLDFQGIPDDISVMKLSDQHVWTVNEALAVLSTSTKVLATRVAKSGSIDFDKDDDDALSFVSAATHLRSYIFGIPQKSKFEIKQMAGNIIPAIATTNAIVSGFGVIEALKLCGGLISDLRSTTLFPDTLGYTRSLSLQPPNPECVVSNRTRTCFHGPPTLQLEVFVEGFLQKELGLDEFSLTTDGEFFSPDDDENLTRTLADLNLDEKLVQVMPEDDRTLPLEVYVSLDGSPARIDKVPLQLRPEVKRGPDDSEDYDIEDVEAPSQKRHASGHNTKLKSMDNDFIDLTADDEYIDVS